MEKEMERILWIHGDRAPLIAPRRVIYCVVIRGVIYSMFSIHSFFESLFVPWFVALTYSERDS